MKLPLMRPRRVDDWETVESAVRDPHTRIYESRCPESTGVDQVTAYVNMLNRMVLFVVDYDMFAPADRVPGGTLRQCVQGRRPGSMDDYVRLLESCGLAYVESEETD